MQYKKQVTKVITLFLALTMVIIPTSSVYGTDLNDWKTVEEIEEPGSASEPNNEESAKSTSSKSESSKKEAADTSKLDDKLSQLKQEEKRLRENLNAIKSDKKDAVATYNAVKSRYDNINAQIKIVDDQISDAEKTIITLAENIITTEKDIEEKVVKIEEKEVEYENSFDEFNKRARIMYRSWSSGSSLDIVLGSESFSEFLRNTSIMSKMAEQDDEIMNDLLNIKKTIEEEKGKLETDKIGLEEDKEKTEELKTTLVVKKEEQQALKTDLNSLKKENYEYVQQLSGEEKDVATEYGRNQEEQAKIEREIQSLLNSSKEDGTGYDGSHDGQFKWPAPGYTKVSMAYMGYSGHSGMDITGGTPGSIDGATVVAAAAGKVIATIRGYSGYGHYIIIDHGSGTTTLYAHLSSISVSKGDTVNASSPIGAAGNTGRSTGPHLHFEVRINGAHTNPAKYFNL